MQETKEIIAKNIQNYDYEDYPFIKINDKFEGIIQILCTLAVISILILLIISISQLL